MKRRFFLYGVLFLLMIAGRIFVASETNVLSASSPAQTAVVGQPKKAVAQPGLFVVKRAIDGDTIKLTTGETVRYIGVDTPESVHPTKKVQCFGKEAAAYNKELVVGRKVRLQKDVSNTDRYGRLLRYVYLSDGTFVNLKLVQEGYAQAATFPPDVKYSKKFVEAAGVAREGKLGLWGKCR